MGCLFVDDDAIRIGISNLEEFSVMNNCDNELSGVYIKLLNYNNLCLLF